MFGKPENCSMNEIVLEKERTDTISQLSQPLPCKIFAEYKPFDDTIKPFRRFPLQSITNVHNHGAMCKSSQNDFIGNQRTSNIVCEKKFDNLKLNEFFQGEKNDVHCRDKPSDKSQSNILKEGKYYRPDEVVHITSKLNNSQNIFVQPPQFCFQQVFKGTDTNFSLEKRKFVTPKMINKVNNFELSGQKPLEVFKVYLENYKTCNSKIKQMPDGSGKELEPPLSPILTKRKSIFTHNCSINKRNKVDGTQISSKTGDSANVSSFVKVTSQSMNKITNSIYEMKNNNLPLSPVLGCDISNPSAISLENVSPLSPILCKPIEEEGLANGSKPPFLSQTNLQSSSLQENHTVLDGNSCVTPVKSVLDIQFSQDNEWLSESNSPVLGCSIFEKPLLQEQSNNEQANVSSQTSPVLSSKCKKNILFSKKSAMLQNENINLNKGIFSQNINSNRVSGTQNHSPNVKQIKSSGDIILSNENKSLRETKYETSLSKQWESVLFSQNNRSNQIQDKSLHDVDIPMSPVLGKISAEISVSYQKTEVLTTSSNSFVLKEHDHGLKITDNRQTADDLNFKQNLDAVTHLIFDQSSNAWTERLILGNIELESNIGIYLNKEKKENNLNLEIPLKLPSFNSELDLSKFPLNFLQIEGTISSPSNNLTENVKNNEEVGTVFVKVMNRTADQETSKQSQTDLRSSQSDKLKQIERLDTNKNLSQNVSKARSFLSSCQQAQRQYDDESRKCKQNLIKIQSSESLLEPYANSSFRSEVQTETIEKYSSQELHSGTSTLKTAKKSLNLIYDSMSKSETVNGLKCNKKRNASLDQGNLTLEEQIGSSLLQDSEKQLVLNKSEMAKFSDFHTPKSCHSFKNCSTNRSKVIKNKSCKTDPGKNQLRKPLSLWKNQDEFHVNNNELKIEEFDDESPLNISELQSPSVKQPIVEDMDKTTVTSQSTHKKPIVLTKKDASKSLLPSITEFQNGFEAYLEGVDILKDKDDSSDESEVEGEAEIHQEATQESAVPAGIHIDCSTSPNTKSTQESQQNEYLEKLSFPPALKTETEEDEANKDGLLDSVSKTKRTKSKRGGLVQRLRRLVRAEKADVNMFHHEDLTRNVKMCSLTVHSLTKVCSRYQLVCSYTDSSSYCSEQLSVGEEVLDPEVQVFVDPGYSKNLSAGCTIWIYPPWSSLWVEGKDLMIMYCVSKLRVIGPAQVLPAVKPQLSKANLRHQFSCLSLDENCGCSRELMAQLFGRTDSRVEKSWADLSIMAAFASGRYPHNVTLKLTLLYRFQARRKQDGKVLPCELCVDGNGHICQLNMKIASDISKIDSLMITSNSKTVILHKLVIYKRIIIDRCKGLRTMLSQLSADSVTQQLMYVLTPFSNEWSAVAAAELSPSPTHTAPLLSLADCQEKDGRGEGKVQVLSLRGDKLYVYEKSSESFFKINVSPSTVLPEFAPRAFLHIQYLQAAAGELTLDKYSSVTVTEPDGDQMLINIPPLSVDSTEGDLVLLDGVVTKVNSEMIVRWMGDCGHKLLKLQETQLFYCVDCRLTVNSCKQQFALEVCVIATSVSSPIRVKVKSETAQSLLVGKDGKITPGKKSYNLISAIGGPLKCTAVILEVLKNPFGDILEFLLEEI